MQRTSRAVRKETLLAAVLDGTADAVFVKDTVGRYLLVNSAGAALLGRKAKQIVGRTDSELLPPATAKVVRANDAKVLASGTTRTYEHPLEVRGTERTYLTNKGPWRDEEGRICGVFAISRDITERSKVERALRNSREQLRRSRERIRALLEAVPDQIYLIDGEGCFVDAQVEPDAVSLGAVEDLRGKHYTDVFDEAVGEQMSEAIALSREEGRLQRVEFELAAEDGEVGHFEARLSHTNDGQTVLIVRDISDHHALESQLRHAQKMEAVGQLAGGVAHDFNNILTTVLAGADVMLAGLDEEHPYYSTLQQIRKAGEHAAVLTHQLLAFSRKQVFNPRTVTLNTVVGDAEGMLRRLIEEDIQLASSCARDLGAVVADPGQIEQILINLVVNARDAMPGGGTITIETANVVLSRPASTRPEGHPIPAGSYVRLSVTDTGTGMSSETLEQLFVPFFTTKAPGKGTGLGLATTRGIVRRHDGFISVESEVGVGTTVGILFPRVEGAPPEASPSESSSPLQGDEAILFVEDDRKVREMVTVVLTQLGYTVLAASNGVEAIRQARTHGDSIALVLSDLVMPGLGGREVAEEVTRMLPDVKVLLCSGYTEDQTLRSRLAEEGWGFIAKPVRRTDLARRIRELLDGPGGIRGRARGGHPPSPRT